MRTRLAMTAGAALLSLSLLTGAGDDPAFKTGVNVWNAEGGEKDEAMKLTPNVEHGKEVYEVCAACHLPEGSGSKDGTFPQIAGQHPNSPPAEAVDVLRARHIPSKLIPVDAVLLAVVFDGHHRLAPAHVQVVPRVAVRPQHRDLRLRRGEAGVG